MPDIYALIPAAGSGSRMGADMPKQYQPLAGRPLITHAIKLLCTHPAVRKLFVVLAPGDVHFQKINWGADAGKIEPLFHGGATRAASVANGLAAVADQVRADDWVMVHDAARPCLTRELLDSLIAAATPHPVGALLAIPVADTLKRAGAAREVEATVARDALWQAQTQIGRAHV